MDSNPKQDGNKSPKNHSLEEWPFQFKGVMLNFGKDGKRSAFIRVYLES